MDALFQLLVRESQDTTYKQFRLLPGLSVVFQNNKVRPYCAEKIHPSIRGLGKNQGSTELEFTFLIAVSEDDR